MSPFDIKAARKKTGLSMEGYAHKLGVSYTTLSRWERGLAKPSPMAINMIKTNQDTEEKKKNDANF